MRAQLEVAATPVRGVRFVGPDDETWTSWEQIHSRALQICRRLSREGVEPGDVVMLIGRTSVELIASIRAAWMMGAAVLVAPVPGRARSNSSASERLEVLAEAASPRVILGESGFLSILEGWNRSVCRIGFSDLVPIRKYMDVDLADVSDDNAAILQPTSGTTQEPRIVCVPRRCVMANLRATSIALQLDPNSDTFVSWLPMSHDMGLVGVLGNTMVWGIELVVADPSTYILDPTQWMRWCSRYQATIAVAPNFAYSLAERHLAGSSDILDLSCLRATLNGAEPIDVDDFTAYHKSGIRHKLLPSSAMCVYGLAEATLAVSFPPLGGGLQIDLPEASSHSNRLSCSATRSHKFAMLGSPLEGIELRISSPITTAFVGRDVGEIELRGPSVTPGYLGQELQRTSDDWLATGDLGYLRGGQLVVCGRSREMIIYGGRNIFPEHIEAVISKVDGVRNGSVVVFGVPGRRGEAVVAVIESRSRDHLQIRRDILLSVLDECDVSLKEVAIVGAGELPKTTSGKLARGRTQVMFEEGHFAQQ
jgi:fatty-acyl-CoA synthase